MAGEVVVFILATGIGTVLIVRFLASTGFAARAVVMLLPQETADRGLLKADQPEYASDI